MDIRKTIGTALLLGVGMLSALTPQQVLDRILTHYQGVRTLSASIVQINEWKELKTTRVSRGTLQYDQKNLLLTYSEPKGQTLTVQERKVIMIDKSQKQAVVSPVTDTMKGIKPSDVIEHYQKGSKLEGYQKDSKDCLKIITKPGSEIKSIDIRTERNGSISEITYIDPSNNLVTYKFSNINENGNVGNLMITIPKGYKVIDTRE
jgi:outer membrane lipoprotein-sorting protein